LPIDVRCGDTADAQSVKSGVSRARRRCARARVGTHNRAIPNDLFRRSFMFKRLSLLACLCVVALSGCAIHQNVKPVDVVGDTQVCVINNPAVRPGVMAAYLKVLGDKGYTVRQLPESAPITDCKVTSTYQANWRWDLAMYMHFAQFRVFVDGKEKGVATYDATRGGANMAKFIDADKKIAELINQLFPGGAGAHAVAPGATVVQ
jgi:hypothetical protein